MLLVSVLIQYVEWSRMGNRMFNYAFGKILARDKGVECFHNSIPDYNIPNNLSSYHYTHEPYVSTRSFGNNRVDYNDLLRAGNVRVDSFLQRAEYYIGNREYVRELFGMSAPQQTINSDKLVIHYRDTDYRSLGLVFNFNFYNKLINESGFNQVVIVTDDSNNEDVKKLLAIGCTLSTEGYVNEFSHSWFPRDKADFQTLLTSENIVVSHSSYSWWAAFLGDHKRIIFPFSKNDKKMWKCSPDRDDIDLYFNLGNSEKYVH